MEATNKLNSNIQKSIIDLLQPIIKAIPTTIDQAQLENNCQSFTTQLLQYINHLHSPQDHPSIHPESTTLEFKSNKRRRTDSIGKFKQDSDNQRAQSEPNPATLIPSDISLSLRSHSLNPPANSSSQEPAELPNQQQVNPDHIISPTQCHSSGPITHFKEEDDDPISEELRLCIQNEVQEGILELYNDFEDSLTEAKHELVLLNQAYLENLKEVRQPTASKPEPTIPSAPATSLSTKIDVGSLGEKLKFQFESHIIDCYQHYLKQFVIAIGYTGVGTQRLYPPDFQFEQQVPTEAVPNDKPSVLNTGPTLVNPPEIKQPDQDAFRSAEKPDLGKIYPEIEQWAEEKLKFNSDEIDRIVEEKLRSNSEKMERSTKEKFKSFTEKIQENVSERLKTSSEQAGRSVEDKLKPINEETERMMEEKLKNYEKGLIGQALEYCKVIRSDINDFKEESSKDLDHLIAQIEGLFAERDQQLGKLQQQSEELSDRLIRLQKVTEKENDPVLRRSSVLLSLGLLESASSNQKSNLNIFLSKLNHHLKINLGQIIIQDPIKNSRFTLNQLDSLQKTENPREPGEENQDRCTTDANTAAITPIISQSTSDPEELFYDKLILHLFLRINESIKLQQGIPNGFGGHPEAPIGTDSAQKSTTTEHHREDQPAEDPNHLHSLQHDQPLQDGIPPTTQALQEHQHLSDLQTFPDNHAQEPSGSIPHPSQPLHSSSNSLHPPHSPYLEYIHLALSEFFELNFNQFVWPKFSSLVFHLEEYLTSQLM
ncbi:uncharacterized protein VP01_292g12 [Puccinia sorghi]|uniref:Uncharacterized protein n=1 Tax=Puccinia sorghi TaxID=27349 RepID=A0A0L6V151_9BASI|nr:uncharacterized protein VP01_292g12 [Puccinia sorghi]